MKKLMLMSLALLAACQKAPPRVEPGPGPGPASAAQSAPAAATPERPLKTPAPMNTIDDYKILVAQQILDANPAITFTGQLPPMLPAIVVVNISVDKNGDLRGVAIRRSRDGEASRVALAAVKKAGPALPKPLHLLKHAHKTLDFSETFLFNAQYHFQLRSLAGPQ